VVPRAPRNYVGCCGLIKGEVAIDCVDVELFLSRDNNFGKARIEDYASPKRARARERGRDRDQRKWG